MLAVLLPSRGLLNSRTCEAVDREVQGLTAVAFHSHAQPIPDCFNNLVRRALSSFDYVSHVWFVEEDVIPPPGTLRHLISIGADIAGLDYPLRSDSRRTCKAFFQGRLRRFGTGCMLVKTEVFQVLDPPWFRTDLEAVSVRAGSASQCPQLEMRPREPVRYGGHDDYFCVTAVTHGMSLMLSDVMTAQHEPTSEHIEVYRSHRT